MPSYKAAHLREQGQNMIIFPLESAFEHRSDADKSATRAALQRRANASGLAGSAVLFWESGGRTHFLGPGPWHPFLRGLSMRSVLANVNKEISWTD